MAYFHRRLIVALEHRCQGLKSATVYNLQHAYCFTLTHYWFILNAHCKSVLMSPTFILLNCFGMTAACMPCLYELCTVAMSLSRDNESLYAFKKYRRNVYLLNNLVYLCTLLNYLIATFLHLIKKKLFVSMCVCVCLCLSISDLCFFGTKAVN